MNGFKPVMATSLLITTLLITANVVAQGTGSIIESRPASPGIAPGNAAATNVGNSDALLLLLEQNRNLQAEVQALRSMVEEQGYEIRKLQRESLDRYTNMDSRLTNLEQSVGGGSATAGISVTPQVSDPGATAATGPAGNNSLTTGIDPNAGLSRDPGSATANPVGNTGQSRTFSGGDTVPVAPVTNAPSRGGATDIASTAVGAAATTRSASRPGLQPAILSEQQLYQMAYDSAINSQFDRAIAEFDQYLNIYPNGRFTTNAHYWKGQAYLYLTRYSEAIESYNLILQEYPDSAKVPDATYGLGVAYEGMGNTARARQIFQEIIRNYPNTGVANLSDTRLLSLD